MIRRATAARNSSCRDAARTFNYNVVNDQTFTSLLTYVSLYNTIGAEQNLLDPGPTSCRRLVLPFPVLDNDALITASTAGLTISSVLIPPSGGTIAAFGKDMSRHWRELRRRIGATAEQLTLL